MTPRRSCSRGLTLLLAHQPGRGRSASRRRSRCSPARCWSATRCAAACAIWCSQRLGRTDRVGRVRPASSARRSPTICSATRRSRPRSPASRRSIVVAGRGHRPGERPPRVARAGLRRRRSLLALSRRRRRRAARRTARRSSARRSRATSAPPTAAPCSSASSGRPRFRSNRCTAARTIPAARCGSTVRAILAPAELGEFSLRPQQGDVRAVFVPLRACSRTSSSPAASTRCWSRTRRRGDRRDRAARGAARSGTRGSKTVGLSLRALDDRQRASRSRAMPGCIDDAARRRGRAGRRRRRASRRSRCSPISPTRSAAAIARSRTRW